MVVLIVHVNRILAFKRKRKPPISSNANGPMPLHVSVKRVQSVNWSILIRGTARHVQSGEKYSEFPGVDGLNSRLRAGFGKGLQSFTPKSPDHSYSV
jgi:hypothetical protein